MRLDGRLAHEQRGGDLRIAAAASEQQQHVALPPVSAASRDGAGEVWAGRRANASISLRVTDGADVVDEIAHRVCGARTRLGEFLLADARDKLSQGPPSRPQIPRGRRRGGWGAPGPSHAP